MTNAEINKTMGETLADLRAGKLKIGEVTAIASIAKIALGSLNYEIIRAKALADKKVKAEFRDVEN